MKKICGIIYYRWMPPPPSPSVDQEANELIFENERKYQGKGA